jgi:hypothetical protein
MALYILFQNGETFLFVLRLVQFSSSFIISTKCMEYSALLNLTGFT